MLLGPYSDCPRLRFNVLSIDYVRVTNCFKIMIMIMIMNFRKFQEVEFRPEIEMTPTCEGAARSFTTDIASQ